MIKLDNKKYEFIEKVNELNYCKNTDLQLKQMFLIEDKIESKFAIVKEVIFRILNLKLFDSQILTAYHLLKGSIVELPTGEGKTLSAVLTSLLFAFEKRKVHVLVFNDYLAKRDYLNNKAIYNFFGFDVGYVEDKTPVISRRSIYKKDVVYISVKEAGFDYLKDFLAHDLNDLTFPGFDVAIVDEADSILLDEARNPLVLAGNTSEHQYDALKIDHIIKKFDKKCYKINKSKNQIWLTDEGISQIEKELNINNLYEVENTLYYPLIDSTLQARFILKRDKDYIVDNSNILVVDQSTGRVVNNRKFPDLIHRAVEIKEQLKTTNSTIIYNSIPIQSFLKLYPFICGMTGTAKTSENEFIQMYNLKVEEVSPHTECIRIDEPFVITKDKIEQEKLIINEIKESCKNLRPVLLATSSVSESERFGQIIKNNNLDCFVLNAKNDKTEAEIISFAGNPSRITVSTNISGRGVDIKLGTLSDNDRNAVLNSGGLYVIGTYLNRNVRIDNQLRGRAGRQGDPGKSKFIISLEDDIIKSFYDFNEIEDLKKLVQLSSFYSIKTLNRAIVKAQKSEEGKDAEIRYILSKYSGIIEQKRKIVSKYRYELLNDIVKPSIVSSVNPELFKTLTSSYGNGAIIAEKQLLLNYINTNWANYLSAMESIRDGIHYVIMGRKNPLEEFSLKAEAAFDEMMDDIKLDVVNRIKKVSIDKNGLCQTKDFFNNFNTTYTYMVDESKSQFNASAQITEAISHSVNEFNFSLPIVLDKLKKIFKF